MKALKTFTNQMLGATIRVTPEMDGKLWIVAKDIFTYLDMKSPYADMQRTPEKDKQRVRSRELGLCRNGVGWITMLSEQGMYGVLMRSRKPKALAFREWVANDVLPQLRLECVTVEQADTVLDPDMLIKLATELKERRAADATIAETLNTTKARATRLERLMGLGGGDTGDWFRVSSIPWLDKYFRLVQPMYDAVEDLLDTLSKSIGVEIAYVPVSPISTKRVFNRKSVQLLKKMLDDDPKLLKRFRHYGNKTSK